MAKRHKSNGIKTCELKSRLKQFKLCPKIQMFFRICCLILQLPLRFDSCSKNMFNIHTDVNEQLIIATNALWLQYTHNCIHALNSYGENCIYTYSKDFSSIIFGVSLGISMDTLLLPRLHWLLYIGIPTRTRKYLFQRNLEEETKTGYSPTA